jgi:uncharacterized protein with FMN-binding domain
MTRTPRRFAAPVYLSAAAATLAGSLAGCASTEVAGAPAEPAASTPSASSGDSAATYRDGEYRASGEYSSPNGRESIGVTLTLENNVVTAVAIEVNPTNPTTERFQRLFADGIAAEVVGRDIDSLDVTRVAGSSLTSGGFREALKTITADALAD